MKTIVIGMILTLFAAAPAIAENAQQGKMKECNTEAKTKNLAGDDRKAFMKQCLSAAKEEAKTALTPQQEKMKTCNADAKSKALKGNDRKAFMKECLSK